MISSTKFLNLLKVKGIFIFTLLWGVLISIATDAGIVIEIVKLPALTKKDAKIYIVGSFNNWDVSDQRFELKRNNVGNYYIELPDSLKKFEYKFTRGSWETVEGNFNGMRPNRIYDSKVDSSYVKVTIESWEDYFFYKLIVTKVPQNTPHDAHIYVAGNFNDWNPCYPNHELKKQNDGTWQVVVFSTLEKLEYKFTRGTWQSVEGRENGRAIRNRVIYRDKSVSQEIKHQINTWEDLTYRINFYDFILILSAFQGILLIIAISAIHENNKEANKLLMWLIGITSLGLITKVLPNYREIFEAVPKLILIPELILLLFAPFFYFYVQKLLTVNNKNVSIWYHFIPCGLLLMLYSPYFMMDRQDFIDKIVDQELYLVFATVGGIALVINGYYWFVCRQIILNYKAQYSKSHSYEQNLQYLSMAIYIMGACLAVWIFTGMVVVAGAILEKDVTTLVEKSTDGIWLVFSTIPYFLGYYAIYQPEIFRLNQNITFLKPVDKGESLPDNVSNQVLQSGLSNVAANNLTIEESEAKLLQLRDKLESYMNEKKPYLNPRLTLIDLAENFQIHPNLLSRVINDCFQKNFFDYINTYRIEEFKRLIKDPKFENYTLLGVAFEVGFNSKTAFNRSFKKITNLTPSEYFYKVNGKVIEE